MSVIDGVRDVPTVYIRIGDSAIAFESSGEILETLSYDSDGRPDWAVAGICDYRGAAGKEGYDHLRSALEAAEQNARMVGYEVMRVPVPS
jgi:hypothetical protein